MWQGLGVNNRDSWGLRAGQWEVEGCECVPADNLSDLFVMEHIVSLDWRLRWCKGLRGVDKESSWYLKLRVERQCLSAS